MKRRLTKLVVFLLLGHLQGNRIEEIEALLRSHTISQEEPKE